MKEGCVHRKPRGQLKPRVTAFRSIAVTSQLFLGGLYADHVQKHLRSGFKFDITGI
jgi:hypothetical protein